jgi:hypothetical protein
MPLFQNDKEKNRFYLLPGMGGKLYRKKQTFIITWSLAAALLVAIVLTLIMIWLNRLHPH